MSYIQNMFSRRSYSPVSSLHNMPKAKSSTNFFRQAKELSIYQKPIYTNSSQQCEACKHEMLNQINQANLKIIKHRGQQDYYMESNNDVVNLKNSKRYLEGMLEKQKREYKYLIDDYDARLTKATLDLQQKNIKIDQLEKQNSHLLSAHNQNYIASASLVKSYAHLNDKTNNGEMGDGKQKKNKEIIKQLYILTEEKGRLKIQNAELSKRIADLQIAQKKAKQVDYYARQYQSMKILITKMEEQLIEKTNRYTIQLKQIQKQHEQQIQQYFIKCSELERELIEQRALSHSVDGNLPSNTNSNGFYQDYTKLSQLYEERSRQCESVHSRLTCVESQLNFIKNKFRYLLNNLEESGPIAKLISSNDEIEEYCIERIGRYHTSTGKESLISMNLSPIKRPQ